MVWVRPGAALEQEKARERLTPAERKAAEDFEADAAFFRTFPFFAKVDPPADERPAAADGNREVAAILAHLRSLAAESAEAAGSPSCA